MSAIAGIIHLKKEPVPFEYGRNIMKGLEKFPADDIQVWHKHNAFIGNHAQWITPESVGEQQPFYDSERQCVITADAIIDNREELFEKLQVERSKQKHMPDSQLILLAYYKWGEDSPKHLVGDFAYMIWDERNQKIFGARDFSGSRTLYYYKDHERFAFCTTIMPLFTLPGVKKELNEQWMAEFLAIYGTVDAIDTSITVYKQITQLPPSHSISIEKNKVSVSRYCKLEPLKNLNLKTNEEYIEAFRDVFQSAVSSRLRTHRNVGSHLSGGLDSGSVVSFAVKHLKKEGKQLHTFSYVPTDDFVNDFVPSNRIADERPFIKSTVEYVGNIKDHYLDFQGRSPFTDIDDVLDAMEMPYKFFENSIWLKGIFEKAREEEVGVLLNGGRGNLTVSWGSALDHYANLLSRLKIIRYLRELKHYSRSIGVKKYELYLFTRKLAFPNIYRFLKGEESIQFPVIINPELANKTGVFNLLKEHGMSVSGTAGPNIYESRKMHFEELFHWNATNTIGTKLSLRNRLWKRDPTNDKRVIQFCLALPEDQYVQNGMDRALIRRVTENMLPEKVRLNQNIRGIQGVDWVHRMASSWDEFRKELREMEKDQTIFEFLDPNIIKKYISKVSEVPSPEAAIDSEYRMLMRSLIVYRFIKKLKGGELDEKRMANTSFGSFKY
jgi:asparagine synthase (glutamine-hydrolysing)